MWTVFCVRSITNLQEMGLCVRHVLMEAILLKETMSVKFVMFPAMAVMELQLTVFYARKTMSLQEMGRPA